MDIDNRLQLIPLFRVVLFLLAGIIAGRYVEGITLQTSVWCMVLTLVVAFLIPYLFKRWLKRVYLDVAVCQSILIFIVVFFLGCTRMLYHRESSKVSLPTDEVPYQAIVLSTPVIKNKVVMVDMVITRCDSLVVPMKVKASFLKPEYDKKSYLFEGDYPWDVYALKPGDGMDVFSVLKEPENFEGSDFDYVEYLHNHGIYATTFVAYEHWIPWKVNTESLSYVDRLRISALALRYKIYERYKTLGLSDQELAVITAMTLGDKSSLSSETKENYSVSGASHVLALSGLHLGIIYAILSLLTLGGRFRRVSQLVIVIAIWTYVFIVGLSLSVVRSALMLTVFSFVTMLGRSNVSINTLSLAAIIMLLVNPANMYDVGFQMSFLAVLFILLLYKSLFSLLPERYSHNIVCRWVWGMVSVSLSAQIGVAPLVAYYFGRFSVYFLLTNFIVVPAATVILYATVILLVFYPLPQIQGLIAKGMTYFVGYLNDILMNISSLPYSSIEELHPNLIQLFCVYVFIAAMYVVLVQVRKMLSISLF